MEYKRYNSIHIATWVQGIGRRIYIEVLFKTRSQPSLYCRAENL